jgi:hypothetical protein
MSRLTKISRRKLLGSAAGATAALPLLHEAVPHQPMHDQLARAAGSDGHAGGTGVIVQIAPSVRDAAGRLPHPLAVGGLLTGLVLMYATGLLVSV